MVLDPSIWPQGVNSKLGVDATRKLPEEGGGPLTERPVEIDHTLSPYWAQIQEMGVEKYLK